MVTITNSPISGKAEADYFLTIASASSFFKNHTLPKSLPTYFIKVLPLPRKINRFHHSVFHTPVLKLILDLQERRTSNLTIIITVSIKNSLAPKNCCNLKLINNFYNRLNFICVFQFSAGAALIWRSSAETRCAIKILLREGLEPKVKIFFFEKSLI